MERNAGRLIEQLQNVQVRQRKVIQQLQAENARRLSDLADVRQERDAFRKVATRLRKENTELQGKLEEVWTEYQDLKRERATLARSVITAGRTHVRNANLGFKLMNTLSVLNEEQTESSSIEDIITNVEKEKAGCPELERYLRRALPDPPKPGSELLRPDQPVTTVITPCNDSRGFPRIQTALHGGHGATL